MPGSRHLAVAVFGCTLFMLAAAPGASADLPTVECTGVPNCVDIPQPSGRFWMDVPGNGQSTWQITCPQGQAVDGSAAYFRDPSTNQVSVWIEQDPILPIYGFSTTAFFLATNPTSSDGSYGPAIGCGPPSQFPTSARASTSSRITRRVKTVRLRSNRDAVYTHRCHAGEHAVDVASGVAFVKAKPPSKRELADVTETHTMRHGRLRFHVKTGPTAGDDEPLLLQMHALCRR
jgi:hypothetical protein